MGQPTYWIRSVCLCGVPRKDRFKRHKGAPCHCFCYVSRPRVYVIYVIVGKLGPDEAHFGGALGWLWGQVNSHV
jgi:hypothetical protein